MFLFPRWEGQSKNIVKTPGIDQKCCVQIIENVNIGNILKLVLGIIGTYN